MAGKPPEQRVSELASHMKEFYSVTERHGRDDLLLGARMSNAGDVGAFGNFTPFFVRLTLILDRWLLDCLSCCVPLSTAPGESPDRPHDG